MEGPASLAESRWLRLLLRGDAQFLLHDGAGEMIALPREDGEDEVWDLKFGSCGSGLLMHPHRGNALASSFLQQHIVSRAADADNVALSVVNRDGAHAWHAVVMGRHVSKAVRLTCGGDTFISEVYHFECLRAGCYTHWCLPWLRKFIYPNLQQNNWCGNNRCLWEELFKKVGLPGSHVIESGHAAKKRGFLVLNSEASLARYPQEWSMSSPGVLMYLARIASGGAVGQERCLAMDRAAALLDALVTKILGTVTAAMPGAALDGSRIVVTNGSISVGDLRESIPAHRYLATHAAAATTDEEVSVGRCLVVAVGAVFRDARNKAFTPEVAGRFAVSVCQLFGDQAAASRREAWWDETSLLVLAPGGLKSRVERVSSAYKEAVTTSVATTSNLRTTSQFFASQSLLQDAHSSAVQPSYTSRNTHRLRAETMYQYWRAMRAAAKTVYWHTSLDGVQVSGDHTVPFIHLLPETNVMLFGPPAVSGWTSPLHPILR